MASRKKKKTAYPKHKDGFEPYYTTLEVGLKERIGKLSEQTREKKYAIVSRLLKEGLQREEATQLRTAQI